MQIGRLRQRVTIQQRGSGRDAFGAQAETWADVATVWGAVEPLQGREFFASQQVNAEITTRIRIRYRSDVVPAMRATNGGKIYDVKAAVDVDGRRRELNLMCRELL